MQTIWLNCKYHSLINPFLSTYKKMFHLCELQDWYVVIANLSALPPYCDSSEVFDL